MKKKFLYILTLVALICSCVKEIPAPAPVNPEDEIGVERDGKVTLGFSVDLGEEMTAGTKALAETPTIQNIYVAVFDATGYKLSEYVKANPITPATTNEDKYQFTIQLKVSDKPRTLHFIANGPKELRFGTEQEVIGELYSMCDADESDEFHRKDAYWQRLVFTKISPRPITSDPDSLAAYNSMVETLSNLKLIRNFSKVTLSKREPLEGDTQAFKDFKILGMWFVNYPDRGSIAPYNRNTGGFGADTSTVKKTYLEYSKMDDVEDPHQGNYQGFTLASTEFVTPSVFDGSNMIAATDNTVSGYVYEREKALTSPMYLIVKGQYNGADAYYKIAMQDEDGDFYAMLRNFNYSVQIQNVSSAGSPTAAAALAGAPTGDISVNIDYKDLPNISDGNARISVSATRLLIVAPDNESTTAKFWYKYEPDITDHSETGIHNDLGKTGTSATDTEWNHNNPHVVITYEGTEGSSGAVVSSIDVEGANEGGNRYVTINTKKASATPKTQTITITGRKWDGLRYLTITRSIELVLRDALEMSLTASPNTDSEDAANVINGVGESVVLHVGIDKDLPSSMFPLAFKINPSVNSLTPDNAHTEQDLPARYGTDESGHPDYWFERVVSWGEYQTADVVDGKKEIPVYFTTIIANSATTVEVSNDNFTTKSVKVKNYTPSTFTASLTGSKHKVGERNGFQFSLNKNFTGDVLITMRNFEPAPEVEGLVFQNTDSDGNRIYKKTLNGYTSGTEITFDVIPYNGGLGTITLSAFLFDDKVIEATNEDGSAVGIDLSDKVSGNVKSNVVIKSYGSASSYIRAAIIANWYDNEGNIVAPWNETQGTFTGLPGSGWTKNADGYYYYSNPVAKETNINSIFTTYTKPSTPPVDGAHLEMTIMVQAVPSSAGGNCKQAFDNYAGL